MALIGNITTYSHSEHATETETNSVTYPADFPDTDLAGTTQDLTTPVMVETTTDYTDVYVVTTWISYYKFVEANGANLFDFTYRVYSSKADRISNPDSHILEDSVLGSYANISSSDDIRAKAYEVLKTKTGLTNLIND